MVGLAKEGIRVVIVGAVAVVRVARAVQFLGRSRRFCGSASGSRPLESKTPAASSDSRPGRRRTTS